MEDYMSLSAVGASTSTSPPVAEASPDSTKLAAANAAAGSTSLAAPKHIVPAHEPLLKGDLPPIERRYESVSEWMKTKGISSVSKTPLRRRVNSGNGLSFAFGRDDQAERCGIDPDSLVDSKHEIDTEKINNLFAEICDNGSDEKDHLKIALYGTSLGVKLRIKHASIQYINTSDIHASFSPGDRVTTLASPLDISKFGYGKIVMWLKIDCLEVSKVLGQNHHLNRYRIEM